jgi:FAD/FMN-containing dehydrogenase
MGDRGDTTLSRRRLLQSGALATASAWVPTFRVTSASARARARPPGFPEGIDLYRQGFENWSKATVVDDLWTCAPRDGAEVVRLANWARAAGWRLRARGAMHGWAPLCITAGTGAEDRVVLLDTTQHLTSIELASEDRPAVRVGAGMLMDEVTEWLRDRGYGFLAAPATGKVTVGGGLAIGMHGASLPARGEHRGAGRTYGSLSNLVVSLTAVVWSRRQNRYVLRTFHRSDPETKAFLVHLGRTFVTDVTLRVAPDRNVRCVSRTDIPAHELLAAPGSPGRTFESFVDESGRVESIWFPFTENPWIKVWSVSPQKPPSSRQVSEPYNYPFSDTVPEEVADLAAAVISGNTAVTPLFAHTEYNVVAAGLIATDSADIWGPSHATHYYIRASTLRVDEQGFAVLTKRKHLQRVLHEFAAHHERRLNELRAEGRFPINGPLEMRACGLDDPGHVGVAGAEAPALSPTVPRRDRRRWDVAVWMNVLTFPGTPGQNEYYAELESWMRSNYQGYAMWRPEWSKGWACTDTAIWDDERTLARRIPECFTLGRREDEDWNWTMRVLDRHDPHRVFSNRFLDRLMRRRPTTGGRSRDSR